jgi:threonine dehydratase
MGESGVASGTGGVRSSTLEAIGGTPVVRLRRLVPPGGVEVLVKLEYFSPTGSYTAGSRGQANTLNRIAALSVRVIR